MNYRHAFHAGNHTEVFKHAILSFALDYVRQKPTPFFVLDTHAGIGFYDLHSAASLKTNEKSTGVERVYCRPIISAPIYCNILHVLNPENLAIYPGSPEISRSLLRDGDRLVVCELHKDDYKLLRARYKMDSRVAVHYRDGYEAIGAFLPPLERRGFVFIDPPYERTDETSLIGNALNLGFKKWATGTYLVWYPIKDRNIGNQILNAARAAGFQNILRAEFCPYKRDGSLSGSGMVICNPYWTLSTKLKDLCEELSSVLGTEDCTWEVVTVPIDDRDQ